MNGHDASRWMWIEKTIYGRMLGTIAQYQELTDVLVFGCGTDYLPVCIRALFPKSGVTAYDIDEEKIAKVQRISSHWGFKDRLMYTTQKPQRQFPVVIAKHVLHHGPQELTHELVDLVQPGGHVGVLDYDMKGLATGDFFQRWGKVVDEERELLKVGRDEAYRLHTTFGLEDCAVIMEQHGIRHVASLCKITSTDFGFPKLSDDPPTLHFYYVGRKNEECI